MYRVGIIGCGFIALEAPDSHMNAYNEHPDTTVVALCDINGKADLTDYHDLPELDIVSVCTPVETHCKIVCDLAPKVKAIYCEKPMATTLEECDQMIEACEKHGTLLQINHQRRFINPKFTFSRDLIDTGTHAFDLIGTLFGEIFSVTKDCVITRNAAVDIEYVNSDEHIFRLDCTRSKEKMIAKGVKELIFLLNEKWGFTFSSGEKGREALKWALAYKELIQ